jgi:hypothetical protein
VEQFFTQPILAESGVPCGTLLLAHVSPYGWLVRYNQHTVNNPFNMHNQLPHHNRTTTCHATLASILPSHLAIQQPCQHPYFPVTLPRQHQYNHLSSILPCVSLSLGHVTYRLPRVTSIQCHVSFPYWSNSA